MYRMIYLSAASFVFSSDDLTAILSTSRQNNHADGISGLLLYHEGSILQVLEGEQKKVEICFERITKDPRHKGVLKLFSGPVEQRVFPNWAMGFAMPYELSKEADAGLKGLGQIIEELPDLKTMDKRTAILIRSFFASHNDLAHQLSD